MKLYLYKDIITHQLQLFMTFEHIWMLFSISDEQTDYYNILDNIDITILVYTTICIMKDIIAYDVYCNFTGPYTHLSLIQ